MIFLEVKGKPRNWFYATMILFLAIVKIASDKEFSGAIHSVCSHTGGSVVAKKSTTFYTNSLRRNQPLSMKTSIPANTLLETVT